MLDNDDTPTPEADLQEPAAGTIPDSGESAAEEPAKRPAKKAAAKKSAAKKSAAPRTAKKTAAKKTTAKKATNKLASDKLDEPVEPAEAPVDEVAPEPAEAAARPKRTRKRAVAPATEAAAVETAETDETDDTAAGSVAVPLFQVPDTKPARRTRKKAAAPAPAPAEDEEQEEAPGEQPADEAAVGEAEDTGPEGGDETGTAARRRRRRGGRRRRKSGDNNEQADTEETPEEAEAADESDAEEASGEGTSRRRRRRRRAGDEGGADAGGDDPQNTVTRVRRGRSAEDEITAVSGSTRLEAKKQRRREGREAGRRRAPIVSEAEFLARRESVERVMVIRQREELIQIAVLEDKVLVEHYVARESQTSLIGNVYLGRVQNVLPSMEAAFVDIGKGRNAVLYAGEVNWSALGHPEGQPRKIESVLSSGQQILVQVTKDPIGHKGARLTSQVSLAGRFLVYVPDGTTSGISRKLPDTERNRLKTLLKEIVPDTAGVIVRTAAEGASEEELTRDVERLKARWEDIEKKAKGNAPQLLYGEPDLTLKVVRDLFTEDFTTLVIEGDDAWETVQGYVVHVAPDLESRLERYRPDEHDGRDVFGAHRIDEQIYKGLDRKVWLPSGGSLVIDRTEAMTVVDVNTGKFTGSGGNLEETVTKNNLEAAEEIVRQLRLRDIGGIIVVDFIDMVLESNRDLVLRRLVECLGRDRTRHQVAEVTSLGLVQMTRKRIGTGLLESFSHECEHCHGRGLIVEDAPVEPRRADDEVGRRGRRGRGRGGEQQPAAQANNRSSAPSPKVVAAMAMHHAEHPDEAADEPTIGVVEVAEVEVVPEEAVEAVEVVPAEEPASEYAASPEVPAGEEPAEDELAAEQAAAEDDVPTAPTTPTAPEPPRVVTRTRRRAASRPAGPPSSAADVSDASGAEAASSVLLVADPLTEEAVADAHDHEHDHAAPALHVPIKKRGSRKR